MSSESFRFNAWLNECMAKNKIKDICELADILGVTRQTIYNWIKHPEKVKKVVLEGIRSILKDENHSVDELLITFNSCKKRAFL